MEYRARNGFGGMTLGKSCSHDREFPTAQLPVLVSNKAVNTWKANRDIHDPQVDLRLLPRFDPIRFLGSANRDTHRKPGTPIILRPDSIVIEESIGRLIHSAQA